MFAILFAGIGDMADLWTNFVQLKEVKEKIVYFCVKHTFITNFSALVFSAHKRSPLTKCK